ncbi:hypothetical protein MUP00_00290, partial [Candidatus Bathyarchaeota archaeon]|nr:hypothetical protein [Candidatus Bathyarchaeota archaeon]
VDALLSETSTEVLTQIFDKRTATFLAWRLKIYQASENDSISLNNAAAFSHALHRILGSGADAIERLILRDMYDKSETSFSPVPGYTFEDHINALRLKIDDFSDSMNTPFSPLLQPLSSLPDEERSSEEEDSMRHGSSRVVFDGVEFSDLTVEDQAIPLEKLKAILEEK